MPSFQTTTKQQSKNSVLLCLGVLQFVVLGVAFIGLNKDHILNAKGTSDLLNVRINFGFHKFHFNGEFSEYAIRRGSHSDEMSYEKAYHWLCEETESLNHSDCHVFKKYQKYSHVYYTASVIACIALFTIGCYACVLACIRLFRDRRALHRRSRAQSCCHYISILVIAVCDLCAVALFGTALFVVRKSHSFQHPITKILDVLVELVFKGAFTMDWHDFRQSITVDYLFVAACIAAGIVMIIALYLLMSLCCHCWHCCRTRVSSSDPLDDSLIEILETDPFPPMEVSIELSDSNSEGQQRTLRL